ncbi:MAG: amino acid permease [Gammaproteobacteria bacterium]
MNTESNSKPALLRVLSLPLILFYGLGNILGAGIYVLIGKVIGYSGYYALWAFMLAGGVAALTALSYAEFSSRFPLSSGAALYVERGFGKRRLATVIGILLVFVGITSAATMTRGFIGYFHVFLDVPGWLLTVLLNSMLGGLAVWGILQSIRTAALFTLLEVGGLLLIIVSGIYYLDSVSLESGLHRLPADAASWKGVMLGAFLAFYAFLGFEDMVNVAEEVRDVRKNMPVAIILSLVIAAVLYIAVAYICLQVFRPGELALSDAPLAEVYTKLSGHSPYLISMISMFAVLNGALIQIIMSSRVCYGMGREGWLPEWLGDVNEKTRTPVKATLLVTALIIILAIGFPIEALARSTSYLLLVIFALVNLALLKLKMTTPGKDDVFRVPWPIPLLGFASCLGLIVAQIMLG